jgi:hypothetical protein
MEGKTLHCPNCGSLMNRHAEKPVKDSHVPEGEAVISVYCCPKCGKVEAEPE